MMPTRKVTVKLICVGGRPPLAGLPWCENATAGGLPLSTESDVANCRGAHAVAFSQHGDRLIARAYLSNLHHVQFLSAVHRALGWFEVCYFSRFGENGGVKRRAVLRPGGGVEVSFLVTERRKRDGHGICLSEGAERSPIRGGALDAPPNCYLKQLPRAVRVLQYADFQKESQTPARVGRD